MSKKATLKSMTLKNFKGIKDLTVIFGEVTTIAGANATGKTTIFDAFTWVLFGKDSNDRTDSGKGAFTVKTVDGDGNPVLKLEHEVSAVLEVDGEEVTLTRTLTEDWVKPRGKAEVELKGNTTHYLCNGVEIKAGSFQEKVAQITEEQLFKLITNPAYFPSLDWKTQREILLRIAGGVTYEEVAAGRADFAAIISQLSGKDLADYKQEIAYRKSKIKEGLEKCPIEINAIDSVTPEAPDYAALEAENNRLVAALEEVEAGITDVAETARKHYEKVQGQRNQINNLRNQQQDVIFKAKQAAQKDGFEKNAKRNEAKNQYDILQREAANYNTSAERELSDIRDKISSVNSDLAELSVQVEAKRAAWNARNAEEYKASEKGLVCPLYETLCTDANALRMDATATERVRAKFEDAKAADLIRITEDGRQLNKKIDSLKESLQVLKKQLDERTKDMAAKNNEYAAKLKELEDAIEANPEVTVSIDIKGEDLTEWKELEAKVAEISGAVVELPTVDTTELTAKKRAITADLDDVKQKLNIRTVIEKNEAKKAEISKREKELAQQLADLEKQEFTADELNKARMDEVERRVNSKFENVRFRMFESQLNGGETPTCVAMVGGVKYSDLNTAGKINAGLDIINTLCLFHGVSAPVFIDNAESVNSLFPVGSQLIKLVVTTDAELTITHQ